MKLRLLVLALVAVVMAIAAPLAFAATNDQGRRLAGPFCVGKRFLKPIEGARSTTRPLFGLAILRAGVVRSVAVTQPCRPWEDRKLGLAWPAGAKGDKGDTGAAGPKGDTGATGATGAAGPAGAAGTSVKITSTTTVGPDEKCPTGAVAIVFSDGTKIEICNGLQGPKGDTGERGLMGPAGPIGPQGLKGDTGATGAAGPAGPTGPVGPKGDTGPAGPAGPKGDTGAQGPAGPAGPKGDTGATGPAGPMGLTGPAGPIGPAGPAGPAGPKGDKGDTGDIGSLETIVGGSKTGDKQFTVVCPAGKQAVSGGFDIQGSVTASYRSNASGNPTGTNAWTIRQSSGADLSGTVYVYCA